MLSWAGYPAVIHFGVLKEEDTLQGHSWVTVHGIPVAEWMPTEAFYIVYSYSGTMRQGDCRRIAAPSVMDS
jgi:hypothetical protein